MSSLVELQNNLLNGVGKREELWKSLKDKSRVLKEYQKVLLDSEIEHIEIYEDNLYVILNDGVKLIWDIEDIRSPANWMVWYKSHEPYDSKILMSMAKESDVIFDIGANIGIYTVKFILQSISMNDNNIFVHSFEPVPDTCAQLEENLKNNNANCHSKVNNIALGSEQSSTTMYFPEFSGSAAASMKKTHPDENNRSIDVTVDTLDNYCLDNNIRKVDLIKIDVEGGELSVLEGGYNFLKKYKPMIFIEILRKWSAVFNYNANEIIKILSKIGYDCYAYKDHNKMENVKQITESTIQTNFIFICKEVHGDVQRFLPSKY